MQPPADPSATPGPSLPLVDMGGFLHGGPAERREVARAFGHAFETTGFAAIVRHDVDEALVDATYRAARAFFARPDAEKRACTAPERAKARGYLPMGIESVAATLNGRTPTDLCEALVFAALHHEREGRGAPNLWPARPADLAARVQAYFDAMRRLCGELMRMSALALDLPEDHFDAAFADPSMTLRFVSYPDQTVEPEPGQLRYGAHHDYGGLTILRQDGAPGGLEVGLADGRWIDAPVVPGSFVVNVGDLMSRWTNGRWRSTLHRVANPARRLTGSTQRLSMVAFTGPAQGTTVACLPTCCSADRPARYPPVEAGAYVRAKIAASMEFDAA